MASKKKKSSSGPIVGLLVVGVVGLGCLAAYVKFGGASRIPDDERNPKFSEHSQPAAKQDTPKDGKVTVITPSRNGDDLKLDHKQADVPTGEDPMLFAVNHFLRESKIVPSDAKAVGVQVKDGVALLDMSPSFNQSYGSMDEEALLKGLCATLAQFKNVDKVQFFVEGKVIDSLGNVDLSSPIPVRTSSSESSGGTPASSASTPGTSSPG